MGLEQRTDSTILKFKYTPHWSTEEYERHRNSNLFKIGFLSDPADLVLYKVTHRLETYFGR